MKRYKVGDSVRVITKDVNHTYHQGSHYIKLLKGMITDEILTIERVSQSHVMLSTGYYYLTSMIRHEKI